MSLRFDPSPESLMGSRRFASDRKYLQGSFPGQQDGPNSQSAGEHLEPKDTAPSPTLTALRNLKEGQTGVEMVGAGDSNASVES